jgi:hypothetical protein
MSLFIFNSADFRTKGLLKFDFRTFYNIPSSVLLVNIIFKDAVYNNLKILKGGRIFFDIDKRTEFLLQNSSLLNKQPTTEIDASSFQLLWHISEKSDIDAKEAYKRQLESTGIYDSVEITQAPSDIVAIKGSQKFFFEIKKTETEQAYFGAATLTEWSQALKTPEHYFFVVAKPNKNEQTNIENPFVFKEFTPAQFMEFSTIPPFKIFFNIDQKLLDGNENSEGTRKKRKSREGGAIKLSIERLKILEETFELLRS